MDDTTEITLKRAIDAVSDPDLDDDVAQELQQDLASVRRELRVLDDAQSLAEFVRLRISQKYEEYARGERQKELCKCDGSACHVQRGETPPKLKVRTGQFGNPPNTEDLILEYLQDHPEDRVIAEIREEWREKDSEVISDLIDITRRAREHTSPELL